jgi:hypothetical protein
MSRSRSIIDIALSLSATALHGYAMLACVVTGCWPLPSDLEARRTGNRSRS